MTDAPDIRVNIIGSGLAGLSAALTLADAGMACRLVSPQRSERAQSVMAEGGINAALDIMGEQDTPEEHFAETMAGGVDLADPNAVWGMVHEAPRLVRDLVALGVPFQTERGRMVQRNYGGQKKKRTAYAKSSTGKVLVTALVDAVRRHEAAGLVERLPQHELLRFDFQDGMAGAPSGAPLCAGAWVRDVYSGEVLHLAGPVILASGGIGGMLGARNTGTTVNTGDVTAIAFAQGVELANLEFLQYHPTTVPITGKRMLISEAARGEGGRLFTLREGRPWYFMEDKYPELGNLMPRDVVSREETRVMADPACCGTVWLDMRGLSRDIWRNRLSDLREEIVHYLQVDPATDPVPVEPGMHYCMGGIYVDEGHRTNVAGLYAAGECACQYHGANRLGGNSLLGAVYGGRVAARTVLSESGTWDRVAAAAGDAPTGYAGQTDVVLADNAAELAMERVLDGALGILRSREGIEAGLASLEAIDRAGTSARIAMRFDLARAMLLSALAREESRGAHARTDFPERDDAGFHKTTVARLGDGRIAISFREIPTKRS